MYTYNHHKGKDGDEKEALLVVAAAHGDLADTKQTRCKHKVTQTTNMTCGPTFQN